MSTERSHGRRGAERRAARSNGHSRTRVKSEAGSQSKAGTDKASRSGGRQLGQVKQRGEAEAQRAERTWSGECTSRGHAKAPSSRAPAERGKPSTVEAPKPTPPGQLKQSK